MTLKNQNVAILVCVIGNVTVQNRSAYIFPFAKRFSFAGDRSLLHEIFICLPLSEYRVQSSHLPFFFDSLSHFVYISVEWIVKCLFVCMFFYSTPKMRKMDNGASSTILI